MRRRGVKNLSALLLVAMLCAASAAEIDAQALVGSWKLFKDDDNPNGPIPEETLNFWPSGKFSIPGDPPHQGQYRVREGKLGFLANLGGKETWISRGLELEGDELRLKNLENGWAHYRRVSVQPSGAEPAL